MFALRKLLRALTNPVAARLMIILGLLGVGAAVKAVAASDIGTLSRDKPIPDDCSLD